MNGLRKGMDQNVSVHYGGDLKSAGFWVLWGSSQCKRRDVDGKKVNWIKSLDLRLVLQDKEKDSGKLQDWKETCWREQIRKSEKKKLVGTRTYCQRGPKMEFSMTHFISISKKKKK